MGAPGTTPGKWRVGQTGFLGTGVLPSSAEMRTEGGPIITCWGACIGPDEALANARQTVASGAMYDALAEIARLRLATDEGSLRVRADLMWDVAEAALAQARGEAS